MIARFSALKDDDRECVFDCIAVPASLLRMGQGPRSKETDLDEYHSTRHLIGLPASTLPRRVRVGF